MSEAEKADHYFHLSGKEWCSILLFVPLAADGPVAEKTPLGNTPERFSQAGEVCPCWLQRRCGVTIARKVS